MISHYTNSDTSSTQWRYIKVAQKQATHQTVMLQQIPDVRISLTEKSNSTNRLNNILLFILKSNKISIFENKKENKLLNKQLKSELCIGDII